jgi:hypothetical protein
MGPPTDGEMQQSATYEVGTRLLVSGEPRWGGAPLDRAIAYGCGGFTRYYEAALAEEWRRGVAGASHDSEGRVEKDGKGCKITYPDREVSLDPVPGGELDCDKAKTE